MDNDNEGCGCYLILAGIGLFSWLIMTITGGGSSNYSAPTNPAYTTPKLVPTYTPPTINYPSRPVVPEPSYSTSSRSETPDDAYDNGYDEGYAQGLEDGRNGRSHGYGYDDSSDYYNYYETRYQEGYESGYDDGYYEGKSKYEEEQENEEEGW